MTALRLDLEWRTTLLVFLLFPALIMLGFWQLDRADEKREIARLSEERLALPPVALSALLDVSAEEYAGRSVRLEGFFEPQTSLFTDNQIRDGRYGHDAFGVFFDERSGLYVLINRGWVAGDSARRSLPELEIPTQRLSIDGTVYVPPGDPYLLEAERFDDLDFPLLVQSMDSPAIRQALEGEFDGSFFPHEVRLLPDQAHGFRRDWPVINVSPQKHQGYALQWFTMAAALLIFFVLRSSNILAVLRGQSSTDELSDQE